jgi:hypothetical protein
MSLLVPVALWPRPPEHEVTVVHARGSPPGLIATGSRAGQLALWSLDGDALCPRAILIGHGARIVAIEAVLFDRGEALFVVSADGMLSVWDPADGRCLVSLVPPAPLGGAVECAAALPGRRAVAYAGRFGEVRVVEVAALTQIARIVTGVDTTRALGARLCAGSARELEVLACGACGRVRAHTLSRDAHAWRVGEARELGSVGGALAEAVEPTPHAAPAPEPEPAAAAAALGRPSGAPRGRLARGARLACAAFSSDATLLVACSGGSVTGSDNGSVLEVCRLEHGRVVRLAAVPLARPPASAAALGCRVQALAAAALLTPALSAAALGCRVQALAAAALLTPALAAAARAQLAAGRAAAAAPAGWRALLWGLGAEPLVLESGADGSALGPTWRLCARAARAPPARTLEAGAALAGDAQPPPPPRAALSSSAVASSASSESGYDSGDEAETAPTPTPTPTPTPPTRPPPQPPSARAQPRLDAAPGWRMAGALVLLDHAHDDGAGASAGAPPPPPSTPLASGALPATGAAAFSAAAAAASAEQGGGWRPLALIGDADGRLRLFAAPPPPPPQPPPPQPPTAAAVAEAAAAALAELTTTAEGAEALPGAEAEAAHGGQALVPCAWGEVADGWRRGADRSDRAAADGPAAARAATDAAAVDAAPSVARAGSAAAASDEASVPGSRVSVMAVALVERGRSLVLVAGCSDGSVRLSRLPAQEGPPAIGRGHASTVRALLCVSAPHDGSSSHVLSGGDEGDVLVWSIQPFGLAQRLCAHTGRVLRLLPCPEGLGGGGGGGSGGGGRSHAVAALAGGFVSVGADGQVCAYALSRTGNAQLRLSLRGHGSAPSRLLWLAHLDLVLVASRARALARTGEQTGGAGAAATATATAAAPAAAAPLSASPDADAGSDADCEGEGEGEAYADDVVHAWSLVDGTLERVCTGADARALLAGWEAERGAHAAGVCAQLLRLSVGDELRGACAGQSAAGPIEAIALGGALDGALGAGAAPPPSSPLLLLVLAVRRLAAAVNNGAATPATGGGGSSGAHGAPAATLAGAAAGAAPPPPVGAALAPTAPLAAALGAPSPSPSPSPSAEVSLCKHALSYLLPWGVDAAFDARCAAEVGLVRPRPSVCFGVRGHGVCLGLLTPAASSGAGRWRTSSHLTALHALAAVTLCNTLVARPAANADALRAFGSLLATQLAVKLPDALAGRGFCPPSLTLLAKTYVDPADAVQQAARVLLDGTLRRMPRVTQHQLIAAWTGRVLRAATPPAAGGGEGAAAAAAVAAAACSLEIHSASGIAVLVLSLLAARFGHALEPAVARALAQLWVAMLHAPHDAHRRLAGEMVGLGFHVWRPFVGGQSAQLLRQLFGLMAGTAGLHALHGRPAAPPRLQPQAERTPVGLGGNPYLGALVAIGSAQPGLFAQLMGDLAVSLQLDAPRRCARARGRQGGGGGRLCARGWQPRRCSPRAVRGARL